MKVIGINGSPHKDGNTFLAIKVFFEELGAEGIETEVLQIGCGSVRGCSGCGGCTESGRCIVPDAQFEEWTERICEADGIFLAAPVYFGAMPGTMKAFLDRFFFQSIQVGSMRHKVGASAAILRRSGGYTTLDDLNRYFFSSEMMIVSSSCPNLIHGRAPGEVLQDIEGIDALKKLARNMSWLLKMKAATKTSLAPPPHTKKLYMSFIR